MKKLATFFSVLAAILLINALPAFSGGTGPYGFYGPSTDFVAGQIEHVAFAGGTGPYGFYGPVGYNMVPGGEPQHVAAFTGSGPYGVYGPTGVAVWGGESSQFASKDECLLVAKNCPNDFSIQQRIDRLNTEIAKGTSVYTPDELNMLHKELDDAYRELNMNKSY